MFRHGLALAVGSLALLGETATRAQQEYVFSPPDTVFTATGDSFVSLGTTRFECSMTEKLRTNSKGKLKVLSVEFTGDNCSQAERLPWKVKQPSFNGAHIKNVEMVTPFGDCNAADFPMFLTAGTILLSWKFADCGAAFSAQLTTSPTLSLVPK